MHTNRKLRDAFTQSSAELVSRVAELSSLERNTRLLGHVRKEKKAEIYLHWIHNMGILATSSLHMGTDAAL
jgi:hypothetical protein